MMIWSLLSTLLMMIKFHKWWCSLTLLIMISMMSLTLLPYILNFITMQIAYSNKNRLNVSQCTCLMKASLWSSILVSSPTSTKAQSHQFAAMKISWSTLIKLSTKATLIRNAKKNIFLQRMINITTKMVAKRREESIWSNERY